MGLILALCSALVWGTGDFLGGRASTRLDAYQVLGISALSGTVMLLALAALGGEPLVIDRTMAAAVAAGLSTALGIASLYRGLSVGNAAVVAPMAGVVAALLPVVYTVGVQGVPERLQAVGFVVALVGIFLVARAAPTAPKGRSGMGLGLLAGIGFGGFLILIAHGPEGAVYVPLAISRLVMLLVAVALMAVRRLPVVSPAASPMGILAGLCDAGGTAFYVLAQQHVRLDVAAVLSSFYPAATVALAWLVTRERITPLQWLGAGICAVAVALIAA